MATAQRPHPVNTTAAPMPTGPMVNNPGMNNPGMNNLGMHNPGMHNPGMNSFDPSSPMSPATRNLKAEAMAHAHKERVESEVNVYLVTESRKAEARGATTESMIEQKRMKDEARAIEHRKREEAKAEQSVRAAEVKADKIIANAKEEAIKLKAYAAEQCEKAVADALAHAERAKAEQQELRKREIVELKDRAEQMKMTGELPTYEKEKTGMGTKMKHALACHHGAT